MATLHRITHARPAARAQSTQPSERAGRPRRAPIQIFADSALTTAVREQRGSHAPLDTQIHWNWRNPLNLIPATILIATVAALLALMFA